MDAAKEKLIQRARELGFARAMFIDTSPFEGWSKDAQRLLRPPVLSDDPEEQLESAKAVVVLLYPYSPLAKAEGSPEVSGYYVGSNAAHFAAMELMREFPSLRRAKLPAKRAAERAFPGCRGRNSLVGTKELGTRVAIQLFVTDEFEPDAPEPESTPCKGCRRCMAACPTKAISEDGLDANKCMRMFMNGDVLPDFVKESMKTLLGCEICQNVCPRNAHITEREPDDGLRDALSYEALLGDGLEKAREYVGKNVSAGRLVAQAAVLAAKEGVHRDLIEALADSENEAVSDAARWALDTPGK